nr:MAG TPA: hypothetical protein [Caudoviricetes sp.]
METQSNFVIYKDQLVEIRYNKYLTNSDIYVLNNKIEFVFSHKINISSKLDQKLVHSTCIKGPNIFKAYTDYLQAKNTIRARKYLNWFKNRTELLI